MWSGYQTILNCVVILIVTKFSASDIVSNHISAAEPYFGGILATNAVHSRQRRSTKPIPKGTSFGVVWCLVFPVRAVTPILSAFEVCHGVKLPLVLIYPEKPVASRIDNPYELPPQLLSRRQLNVGNVASGLDNHKFRDREKEVEYEEPYLRNGSLVRDKHGEERSDLTNTLDGEVEEQVLKEDRWKSRKDRLYLYADFQAFLEKMGLPGKPCLLRTICEIGQHPFDDSLFGEPLNIIMMPSLGGVPSAFEEEGDQYNAYIDAELHGRNVGDCDNKYSECSSSVFFLLYDLAKDMLL